jgi:hypothetical protein
MSVFRKFISLSSTDRALIMRALIVSVALRFALVVLPFDFIRRMVASTHGGGLAVSVETIMWVMRVVRRRMPSIRCLARSFAAQHLLLRSGYPAELKIGVKRLSDGALHAHAWIECEGKTLLDEVEALSQFSVFPSFNDKI